MKSAKRLIISASLVAATIGLTGCAGMSNQDRNTAIGAGAGAVIGGALTGGSPAGVVGGAAVGGVVGNQVKTTR
jgi:osmotically inducible lipoprotein OsmB